MQPHAEPPHFETGEAANGIGSMQLSGMDGSAGFAPDGATTHDTQTQMGSKPFDPAAVAKYNQAQFQQFMPGYEQQVSQINASRRDDGMLEVRHKDGTGTAFYDKTAYQSPRGDYKVYEDSKGGQWYAISGTPSVERKPVYDNGKPVYDDGKLKTVEAESVRYKTSLTKFDPPAKRNTEDRKPPKRKS